MHIFRFFLLLLFLAATVSAHLPQPFLSPLLQSTQLPNKPPSPPSLPSTQQPNKPPSLPSLPSTQQPNKPPSLSSTQQPNKPSPRPSLPSTQQPNKPSPRPSLPSTQQPNKPPSPPSLSSTQQPNKPSPRPSLPSTQHPNKPSPPPYLPSTQQPNKPLPPYLPSTLQPNETSSGEYYRVNTRKYFGYVPSKNDTSFTNQTLLKEEFLHGHNWVRKQYNLPPYEWDEKLASYARWYLMQRYGDCKVIHSNSSYGENLFWGKKLNWSPSDATYYWYIEKKWFDFKTLTCAPPPRDCGHFTQVVWRDSQRIGCALQHCQNPDAGMLIVCEYDPAGNFPNENPLQMHTR